MKEAWNGFYICIVLLVKFSRKMRAEAIFWERKYRAREWSLASGIGSSFYHHMYHIIDDYLMQRAVAWISCSSWELGINYWPQHWDPAYCKSYHGRHPTFKNFSRPRLEYETPTDRSDHEQPSSHHRTNIYIRNFETVCVRFPINADVDAGTPFQIDEKNIWYLSLRANRQESNQDDTVNLILLIT